MTIDEIDWQTGIPGATDVYLVKNAGIVEYAFYVNSRGTWLEFRPTRAEALVVSDRPAANQAPWWALCHGANTNAIPATPTCRVPELPVEVWNPRPVDPSRAMDAVRAMCGDY
jgi:hypothetical protein